VSLVRHFAEELTGLHSAAAGLDFFAGVSAHHFAGERWSNQQSCERDSEEGLLHGLQVYQQAACGQACHTKRLKEPFANARGNVDSRISCRIGGSWFPLEAGFSLVTTGTAHRPQ
jgi:hypothetical protein